MDGPMEPVLLMALLLIAVGAGIVGAVFGLGGGIIFIPPPQLDQRGPPQRRPNLRLHLQASLFYSGSASGLTSG